MMDQYLFMVSILFLLEGLRKTTRITSYCIRFADRVQNTVKQNMKQRDFYKPMIRVR